MTRHADVDRIIAGRYRLGRALGSGAHGTVYLAEDLGRGGSHVALKLVEGLVGVDDQGPADEVLRHFRHPCWASVLDGGWADDQTWFTAIQYVPGESLEHVEGPQDLDRVYRFLEDGARVLGAMHRAGLIHYDVTPGNVILHDDAAEPHFVLTDGGLANVGAVEGSARGTPLYMAPEVTEAGGHDHRADLYSLGLVAFRLATGTDPFPDEGGAGEILGRRRREDAPRAATLRPDLPKGLDALLADLLARDPNARPYDALAVLERLGDVQGCGLPIFRPEEVIAAAEGGRFVGEGTLLERFEKALEPLRARIDAGSGRLAAARAPTIHDPVLILRGAPGAGCTRLSQEMFAAARDARIPAVLMSGREAPEDRGGPLRYLVKGMATLGLGPEDEPVAIALDGEQADMGREERAHADTRAVEAFLAGVEATSKRTPFVLVVEDYDELSPRAKAAVRVLSRHLLAHRDNGGSASAPPVVVVMDLGSADPEELLVPDAEHPERPLLDVPPLTQERLLDFMRERFVGLEPGAQDLERIARVSESRPGALAGLLAEGSRRNDLSYESGRWSWVVDRLDEYDIQRGLAPVQANALHSASDALVRMLTYLSLVEAPLSSMVLKQLCQLKPSAKIPSSPLIRSITRDRTPHFAIANLAIRRAIRDRLSASLQTTLASDLLDALNKEDSPHTALDRAHILLADHKAGEAASLLGLHWRLLPAAQRHRAQPLLASIAEGHSLDGALRATIAGLIEHGSDAARTAVAISRTLPDGDASFEVTELALECLWDSHLNVEALALLGRLRIEQCSCPIRRSKISILGALVQFRLQKIDAGREYLRYARREIQALRSPTEDALGVLARLLNAEAQAQFLRGRLTRARSLLLKAYEVAGTAKSRSLCAQSLNSLGIIQQQLCEYEDAQSSFREALDLRRNLGDVRGLVATKINLGRVHQQDGALVRSASLFQSAASIAQRYGHIGPLATALRLLADTYDRQFNARLASATLVRVYQATAEADDPTMAMQAAWALAPISAAIGDWPTTRRMLVVSVRSARNRASSYARATHYLCSGLSHLHAGHHRRAAWHLVRAIQHREQLFAANRDLADQLTPLVSLLKGESPTMARAGKRPTAGEPDRDLFRAALDLCLAARGRTDLRGHGKAIAALIRNQGTRHGSSGQTRRALIEVALAASGVDKARLPASAWKDVEQILGLTGERLLLARALARRSTGGDDLSESAWVRYFSRAVQLVDQTTTSAHGGAPVLPTEHRIACHVHAQQLDHDSTPQGVNLVDAHAIAHQLLLKLGYSAAPDHRIASALRRVLAATTRMNAGASLDEILSGMTSDTIEITGAERACVVLIEATGTLQMRVAQSTKSPDADLGLEDLSKTVIQRVIESREALLLHDVFDDLELMGRPSITSLSLRSILCVPMLRNETMFGVLYADSASAAGSFDGVDKEVLSLFSEQAAGLLVAHRLVADLQNSMQQLKATQERLVKGERLRTMGELSSGVAHEFNNLLTSILARVQLIGMSPIDPDLRQDLDLIEKACRDAAEVVRRLQQYTRKQQRSGFVEVDMAGVCRDAVDFLRPLSSTRRRHGLPPIVMRLRADGCLPVAGNPTELREVLTNLVKNSLDALGSTPVGGEIRVSAQRHNGAIHVSVEDDGPGIPTEIQDSVFDAFFTTKGEKGTGLGLCLSHQIMGRHGGELSLHSSPNEGCRFDLVLPELQSDSADPSPPSATHPEHKGPEVATKTVLVVDDDDNIRTPLGKYLADLGYTVLLAKDGAEALDIALLNRPSIVISDVAMPRMNGIDLCRSLREESPGAVVVLMSGWTSTVDRSRAAQAGAAAVISKPFTLSEMADLISNLGWQREQEGSPPARAAETPAPPPA